MESLVRQMTSLLTEFYKDKKVFVTGHTGFKGSWLCAILIRMGAQVSGYSQQPPTKPSLFELAGIEPRITHIIGDVRDYEHLFESMKEANPDVILHLAAQPIVRESYRAPRTTYESNVMGTVNILECLRMLGGKRSFLNVTTDKVYHNNEWAWGYRETDPLDGYDPYSNSKSCSELVTHSYKSSFFDQSEISVSTARAGNVIGGGDFAADRIIPDCVRAALANKPIIVRNPCSTRPYQHVLEPLFAYLQIAKEQYGNKNVSSWYNVGPDDCDCVTTGQLVDLFCKVWGESVYWLNQAEVNAPHEANFLKLDCSKMKTVFGWHPKWHIKQTVEKTIEWTKAWRDGKDVFTEMIRQIDEYSDVIDTQANAL